MNQIQLDALEKVEAYLTATGLTKSRFGLMVAKDTTAVTRLTTHNVRTSTVQAMLDFIRDNPPETFAKQKQRAAS
ncbi:MAG: hypothetical protein AAGA36_00360 [Pseudomonadota bacterium]